MRTLQIEMSLIKRKVQVKLMVQFLVAWRHFKYLRHFKHLKVAEDISLLKTLLVSEIVIFKILAVS